MKNQKKIEYLLGGTLFFLVLLSGVSLAQNKGLTGAIFTTDAGGNFVNANVYNGPDEPYLNGGPRPNAPCTAAGLPNGEYYFQVTDPSGSVRLSTDDIEERRIRVFAGIIIAYLGTTHFTSFGQCGDITVQLSPFSQTPNPGGEYKVWMTPVSAYSPGAGSHGFLPKSSKTDNFKVNLNSDSDGDGIPDAEDNCPDIHDPTNNCGVTDS